MKLIFWIEWKVFLFYFFHPSIIKFELNLNQNISFVCAIANMMQITFMQV